MPVTDFPFNVLIKSADQVVYGDNNELVHRQYPRFFGYQSIPEIVRQLTSTITFDGISSRIDGEVETLMFTLLGVEQKSISITWDHLSWNIRDLGIVGTVTTYHLLMETGDSFLLESEPGVILLE
jgi:hypothetical protein